MHSSQYQHPQPPHAPPVLPSSGSSSNSNAHLYASSLPGQWGDRGRETAIGGHTERAQHYPPIRTRSGDWDQSRPQMSGRVTDLGGGGLADVGARTDSAAPHQQQQSGMMSSLAGPSYQQTALYELPSTSSSSVSARPSSLDAAQYYQSFNSPLFSHNQSFYLPPHAPQPPQQHFGAISLPTFQHQPQIQSQSRPSSSGGNDYNDGKNPSPTLPSAAYYQQHRHSYPNLNYHPLPAPNSLTSTPALTNASRPSTAGAGSGSTSSSSSTSSAFSLNSHSTVTAGYASPALPSLPAALPPTTAPIGSILQRASLSRASYHSGDPVLAYNPAREPSAPTKAIVHRGGVKYAVGTTNLNGKGVNGGVIVGAGKARLAELQASCYTCGQTSAKLLLRGTDVEFGPRADFTCLACLPPDAVKSGTDVGDIEDQQYSGTLSAAVDRLEGLTVRTARIVTPEETQKQLPASHRNLAMTCELCSGRSIVLVADRRTL